MSDGMVENPHAQSVENMITRLEVDTAQGLDQSQTQARLKAYRPNRLRRQKKKNSLTILVQKFNSIIVWLLAAAALMSFVLTDIEEGIAIVVVLLINGAIGFFTELRAARSMEALMQIAEVQTRVRRGGDVRRINAYEIVPGDVVILEAGDVVTADLRLPEAHVSVRHDDASDAYVTVMYHHECTSGLNSYPRLW